jgi:hypothetical protein
MGKYFTVEVKPTIPNVAAGQHAAFGDNDLVFDWYAFDIPKGTSRMCQANLELRPKGDAGATPNEFDIDLLFAKTVNGNAPTSAGTVNSAAFASAVNLSNHMVDFIPSSNWNAHEAHLDSTAFANIKGNTPLLPVFTGEPDSGTNVGYDRFYVAGIAAGALDFVSGVTINNGTLDGSEFTVDGRDPRLAFAVGDVIAATTTADTAVSKSLGTIKSMADANTITLETTTENAIVDGDFIYNTTPIRILLHFEK